MSDSLFIQGVTGDHRHST